jgi:hypothetical protein
MPAINKSGFYQNINGESYLITQGLVGCRRPIVGVRTTWNPPSPTRRPYKKIISVQLEGLRTILKDLEKTGVKLLYMPLTTKSLSIISNVSARHFIKTNSKLERM